MNNLEVDRLIRELHMIGTQLKRIADAMAVPVVEVSPFVEQAVKVSSRYDSVED